MAVALAQSIKDASKEAHDRGEHELLLYLQERLREVPLHLWEELFGDELVVRDDFAPNIPVYLIFTDGNVVRTKGSWAFLKRSLFDVTPAHPCHRYDHMAMEQKQEQEGEGDDNEDSRRRRHFSRSWTMCDGSFLGYFITYDGILAEAMGRVLYGLIDVGEVARVPR